MAILVTAKDVTKSFGGRTLFSDINFVVEDRDRIGLIGPNGAGKSTLLRVLAGETEADSGEISAKKGLRLGWLEQTPRLDGELTVANTVHSPELISKLELSPLADRQVKTLSGGWQKRVALARELTKEPELLLLDEPTNHLDIESILWLESFLARASFGLMVVTHDRLFLQRVTNRILELDKRNPKGLLNVAGDYTTYLQRKEELLAQQETLETKLRNTLRRETEWLRRGPKARTTKQNARIKAAHELQAEVNEISSRNVTGSVGLEFQANAKQPKRLIEGRKISKKLGDKNLFKDLDVFIGPGTRLGLLGRNGCGKSTLIKVLLDKLQPDSGQMLRSEHLKVAYFEQNREALDPQMTLRKTLCPHGESVNFRGRLVHIHGYLDRFLFRKDQADLPISRLSGGEQSRVLLARLMLQEANILVLDEPTNDLDVQTLDVLEECLTQFEGAVILVTHDRFFLDQVANTILAFPETDPHLIAFADLSQWENWHQEQTLQKRSSASPPRLRAVGQAHPEGAPEPRDPHASLDGSSLKKKKKLSYNDQREFNQIEGKIEKAEALLASLEAEAALPENQSNATKLRELYEAISKAQVEVETLYARWSELEALQSGV